MVSVSGLRASKLEMVIVLVAAGPERAEGAHQKNM